MEFLCAHPLLKNKNCQHLKIGFSIEVWISGFTNLKGSAEWHLHAHRHGQAGTRELLLFLEGSCATSEPQDPATPYCVTPTARIPDPPDSGLDHRVPGRSLPTAFLVPQPWLLLGGVCVLNSQGMWLGKGSLLPFHTQQPLFPSILQLLGKETRF